MKIWFQNRRSKYKKLLKQFGLSSGRVAGGAVMESTVSSNRSECAAAVDAARIKSSPQSFDNSPDAVQTAVAATSTTTDEMLSIDLRRAVSSGMATMLRPPGTRTCWPASRDNSQNYLAVTYDFTDSVTPTLYTGSQHDFVSMPRTSCYQPWCVPAEHCHHNLFT